jgi:hypothetical protein
MRKIVAFLYGLIFVALFSSCNILSQGANESIEGIKPGDMIGEMTVEQGTVVPYPSIWHFCDSSPDEFEPFTYTTACEVPQLSSMDIGRGWYAKESYFESNMEVMTLEIIIDEKKLDLDTFEYMDSESLQHGENYLVRDWVVTLKNITPGEHTVKITWILDETVDDGFNVYQPGRYETSINMTVMEKPEYPTSSSDAAAGLNPFTSEKAGLDYLLYLPESYDSNEAWPLIIFLHGAPFRGVPLDLLAEEALPHQLENEDDFPFIVLTPLGDGEYEFWAEDKLIEDLFVLLEEFQTLYNVDQKRIFLTGTDMGGNGVWVIGLKNPEYFAAIAPVNGYFGFPFEVPENICDLKDVPVWAFHSERQEDIPLEAEKDLIDALNECGGNAKITVSPRMGIDMKVNVYRNPELFDWFLAIPSN